MQLLGENTEVATESDVSEREEQNIARRLSSKHTSFPIGCTECTENYKKVFSRCNVEKSLYLLILMMDDSTTFQEGWIHDKIMERLKNELSDMSPRGQSLLMMKCVAEQILGNWLDILSTYIEIYSLDVEVNMEAEVNELKHFCIKPSKGSKEKQLIEFNQCRTLMMNFGIIGKPLTANEKTVLCEKYFVVLYEHVENILIVNELEF